MRAGSGRCRSPAAPARHPRAQPYVRGSGHGRTPAGASPRSGPLPGPDGRRRHCHADTRVRRCPRRSPRSAASPSAASHARPPAPTATRSAPPPQAPALRGRHGPGTRARPETHPAQPWRRLGPRGQCDASPAARSRARSSRRAGGGSPSGSARPPQSTLDYATTTASLVLVDRASFMNVHSTTSPMPSATSTGSAPRPPTGSRAAPARSERWRRGSRCCRCRSSRTPPPWKWSVGCPRRPGGLPGQPLLSAARAGGAPARGPDAARLRGRRGGRRQRGGAGPSSHCSRRGRGDGALRGTPRRPGDRGAQRLHHGAPVPAQGEPPTGTGGPGPGRRRYAELAEVAQ